MGRTGQARVMLVSEMEVIFQVRDSEQGGYSAQALGHAIFTQGDTWEELRVNVLEATALHFEESLIEEL